jgi:hypothetical protein
MSYSRPPVPGIALKQNPAIVSAGSVLQVLDSNISSTTDLGVVQVGSGLSITPQGVLSTTGSGLVNVKIANSNYIALASDYYIGANTNGITITLPLGVTGKIYVVKNQVNGNVTLAATAGQQIDNNNTKTLGSNKCVIVLFNGTRWSIISEE